MSYSPTYRSGDHKAICDVCGRISKASEMRKRWDGLVVDSRCFEIRHPQDFVRAKADIQAPAWTRPEILDTFLPINYTSSVTDNVGITLGAYYQYMASIDYFSEDYLVNGLPVLTPELQIVTSWIRTLSDTTTSVDYSTLSIGKGVSDTTTSVNSGSIVLSSLYVDITYFSEDYISNLVTTTFS